MGSANLCDRLQHRANDLPSGLWTVAGLLIAGFFAWIALGDLEQRRLRNLEALDYISRHGSEMEAAVSFMSSAGISAAEVMEVFSKNQPIGDVSCKFNAQSPHLRCAINPKGSCEGCKDYEKA